MNELKIIRDISDLKRKKKLYILKRLYIVVNVGCWIMNDKKVWGDEGGSHK